MIARIDDMKVAVFFAGIDYLREVEAVGGAEEAVVNENVSVFVEVVNYRSETDLKFDQFS